MTQLRTELERAGIGVSGCALWLFICVNTLLSTNSVTLTMTFSSLPTPNPNKKKHSTLVGFINICASATQSDSAISCASTLERDKDGAYVDPNFTLGLVDIVYLNLRVRPSANRNGWDNIHLAHLQGSTLQRVPKLFQKGYIFALGSGWYAQRGRQGFLGKARRGQRAELVEVPAREVLEVVKHDLQLRGGIRRQLVI